MIKVKSISINGNDKDLENILNKVNAKGYKIVSVIFIGFNSLTERIYQIIYEKE